MRSSGAGTSNEIPLQESGRLSSAILITLPILFIAISCFDYNYFSSTFNQCNDVKYFAGLWWLRRVLRGTKFKWTQPQRHNSPNILNSTEVSEQHTVRMPLVSSIASPEPRIFTIDDDSNEPTIPYDFGRQLPIVPPSLNDLNLPPIPFNILMTMAIANNNDEETHDGNYSPESPDPSVPSSISSPPGQIIPAVKDTPGPSSRN